MTWSPVRGNSIVAASGRRRALAALAVPVWLAACGGPAGEDIDVAGPPIEDRARSLAQEAVIVDTHIDVPYRLHDAPADISGATDGNFDHPKAIAGGLDAAFMSIYVPASTQTEGGAYELANELIDMVEGFVSQAPDRFAIATSPAAVRELASREEMVALPLGMENGAPIRTLEDLRHFYDRGVRYITLTHGQDNAIADSSFADTATWGGLSDYGREVVAEMNRLGIMVDISHVSDEAFWDALEVSTAPMIASHSSCRHFTPGFERNMSDEMIAALAEKGGVVQINFGSGFLTEAANADFNALMAAREEYVATHAEEPDPEAARAWYEEYRAAHPFPYADVADVADHVEHVVAVAGVDHVGLGSDFDGVGDTLPTGLKDVSGYPNLVAELMRRDWNDEDIRKVLGENLLRVWSAVETQAIP